MSVSSVQDEFSEGCRRLKEWLSADLLLSRATVERTIAALFSLGKIEHRGSKKTGGYYVKEG